MPPRDTRGIEELIETRFGLAPSTWQRERLQALLTDDQRMPTGAEPLEQLVEELTVGETYFFREQAQIDAIVQRILPEHAKAGRERKLRVLSVGCSSGEEPYTIAIAADAIMPELAPSLMISGIDVSRAAIKKARRARYSPWALRSTTPEMRERFFERDGDEYTLVDSIRHRVSFEEANLLDELFRVPAGSLDVVLCRNVLIYFSDRSVRRALLGFARALVPNGYLFLGHSESLRGVSDDFELIHDGEAFYYRSKGGPPRPSPPPPRVREANLRGADASSGEESFPDWVEEIHRSTERIARITGAYAVPAEAREVDPTAALTELFDLLEAERHDEALSRICALSARFSTPASLLSELDLCRAAIYGEKGRSRDAERLLAALLARGACETGAHYLLGLLRENERDIDRAAFHYRESMQLDARFSLPYLRLGMLLRRAGDERTALELLDKALELLAAEARARVVIFGGGFRREVLLELCKAQLDALRAGY